MYWQFLNLREPLEVFSQATSLITLTIHSSYSLVQACIIKALLEKKKTCASTMVVYLSWFMHYSMSPSVEYSKVNSLESW